MPRYRDPVLVDAGDVRRVRAATGFTVTRFALELGVDRRTVQRWEAAGAVLERWPSLLMGYHATTLGRLDRVARLGGLQLEVLHGGRGPLRWRRVAVFRRLRHFRVDREKRPRKTRQATRSGRGPLRRHGEKSR